LFSFQTFFQAQHVQLRGVVGWRVENGNHLRPRVGRLTRVLLILHVYFCKSGKGSPAKRRHSAHFHIVFVLAPSSCLSRKICRVRINSFCGIIIITDRQIDKKRTINFHSLSPINKTFLQNTQNGMRPYLDSQKWKMELEMMNSVIVE